MRLFFSRFLRFTGVLTFVGGLGTVLAGCTSREGALFAAMLVLLNFCSGPEPEEVIPPDPIRTIVVSSGNMNGWVFGIDGINCTDMSLVDGAVKLHSTNATQICSIGAALDSFLLNTIAELSYATYLAGTSDCTVQRVALQFNYDEDVTNAEQGWQGRLVFEPNQTPAYNASLAKNVWQTWDTLQGNWWASPNGISAVDNACTQAAPCSWESLLIQFPNIGIHQLFGGILLKAGSGWGCNHEGFANALRIVFDNGAGFVIKFES